MAFYSPKLTENENQFINMYKIAPTAIFIVLLSGIQTFAQIKYSVKTEAEFLKYKNNTIQVDPGPNWKGYYLNDKNGVAVNITNGINFKHRLFAGLGIGYLNFGGINGLSIFSDFEYVPLKTKLSPLLNLKVGYSHIWNQYENGTGTALCEFCLGVNYRLTERRTCFLKSGFLITQQSFLVPVSLGLRF